MNPITLFLVIACALVGLALGKTVDLFLAPPFLVAAVIIALSLKMANTWQKFVVLRAGKLQGVKGPGLFLILPIIDNVVAVIDERIQTTAFNAEQALTKDTVPVNVDAIIFWHVHDARKAALEITDYRQAIDRVAQTSLREMIGSSMLAALLSDRKAADEHLRDEIGNKTAGWGVSVTSVEIRDVAIPVALQDAMSHADFSVRRHGCLSDLRRTRAAGQVRIGLAGGGRRIRTLGPHCDGRRFRTAGTSADRGFRVGRRGGDVAARHQGDSVGPSSRIPVKDS